MTVMERMKAIEEAIKVATDLKEAVINLTDNVAELHQAVMQMSIQQKSENMSASIRAFIIVPSILVSVSSILWIFERINILVK